MGISFDSGVLSLRNARLGNGPVGFSMETNASTTGQVTLALAGATLVSGSGVVAYLEFLVIGPPSSFSDPSFELASLNDGAIQVITHTGRVNVNDAFNVSGTIRYYSHQTPVPGTNLVLDGATPQEDSSGDGGTFGFTNLFLEIYTLTPERSEERRVGEECRSRWSTYH